MTTIEQYLDRARRLGPKGERFREALRAVAERHQPLDMRGEDAAGEPMGFIACAVCKDETNHFIPFADCPDREAIQAALGIDWRHLA